MKLSAFTIIRDAELFDFQIKESILSVLPIVDEYIVNVGKSRDHTVELIRSIGSGKIRIMESEWDSSQYNTGGQLFAHETNLALKACTGDWCIYLQGDEVLHENALPVIQAACEKYLDTKKIDGFLLRYVHIYADYRHYIDARHFAYPKEIRIVRNDPDIHSWKDAQSFRKIKDFDYRDYYQIENSRKLNCILLDKAFIFHYGWSRNPYKMVGKKEVQDALHSGEKDKAESTVSYYDYGNISLFPEFHGSHPEVMKERIRQMDWQNILRYSGAPPDFRKIFSAKYRIINRLEKLLPEGNRIGGFVNYKQSGIFRN